MLNYFIFIHVIPQLSYRVSIDYLKVSQKDMELCMSYKISLPWLMAPTDRLENPARPLELAAGSCREKEWQ